MENKTNSLEPWVMLLLFGLLLYPFWLLFLYLKIKVDDFVSDFIRFYNTFEGFAFEKTLYFQITILTLAIIMLILFFYRTSIKIHNRLQAIQDRIREIRKKEIEILDFIKIEYAEFDLDELIDFKEKLIEHSKSCKELERFTIYLPRLKEITVKLNKKIEEKEHEKRIYELNYEERRMKEVVEELDRKIYLKQMVEDDKKNDAIRRLKTYDNPVFARDTLNEKQVVALLENNYYKVNEYCIIEKKIKPFLVQPTSNHSKTHTFLVWNVRELLKRMDGIESIREHESVDADLTFKYKSKTYALEIETGTLLGKKKQTQDKINFLNQKYSSRWFFIVSNKTILPKYSKLGPATQRRRVLEKLQKMLK